MDLKGISVKGSSYQNLSPRRMPAEQQRPSRRGVRREILNDRRRDRQQTFSLDVGGDRQKLRRGRSRGGPWTAVIHGADAVVNLAGAGIGDERWSAERKTLIRDSRIRSTRSLVAAIAEAPLRPPVFISASGVGYYGASGTDTKTEASPAGSDFLAQICTEW